MMTKMNLCGIDFGGRKRQRRSRRQYLDGPKRRGVAEAPASWTAAGRCCGRRVGRQATPVESPGIRIWNRPSSTRRIDASASSMGLQRVGAGHCVQYLDG